MTEYAALQTPFGDEVHLVVGMGNGKFEARPACRTAQMYVGGLVAGPITCEKCKTAFPKACAEVGTGAKPVKRTRADIKHESRIKAFQKQCDGWRKEVARGEKDLAKGVESYYATFIEDARDSLARSEAALARLMEA